MSVDPNPHAFRLMLAMGIVSLFADMTHESGAM
jgi:hypothetical protein